MLEVVDDCRLEMRTAGQMMHTPERAYLEALERTRLAYVPLMDAELLKYAPQVFDVWPTFFKEGVLLFEDYLRGAEDEPDPEVRFHSCCRLRFEDGWCLQNGGFIGRFFIWIDHPRAFMNFSFSEFSGLCCPTEYVETVFGRSLAAMVDQFTEYAEESVEEDQPFYRGLAEHYSKQWLLRGR